MVYGSVELGGTKTVVAVGSEPQDMGETLRIPTESPDETLAQVVAYLSKHDIEAVGIASFGPVELRSDHPGYGTIGNTPKAGWSGTPVLGRLSRALGVPAGFDTDVNGAALGEGSWGAAIGLDTFVYITVGTGVGLGAVIGGRPLRSMAHPELGHVVVRRRPSDDYGGGCPFHGACLEGMAAGPALEARFGPRQTWRDPGAVTDLAIHYLAQGLRAAVYAYAPQRIIVGGGVSDQDGFHERLHARLLVELAGYPGITEHSEPEFLCEPALGNRSGLAGGLVLARDALS